MTGIGSVGVLSQKADLLALSRMERRELSWHHTPFVGIRMTVGVSTVSAVDQVATIAIFSWQQRLVYWATSLQRESLLYLGIQKVLKSWCEPREGNQRLTAMGAVD